ncbi:MAG: DUF3795 domain-containing protein, partial [Anaerolineae bacterium]
PMDQAAESRRRFSAGCGEYCRRCGPVRTTACQGCAYQLGITPAGEECGIYFCAVVQRGLEHCGLCPDFPCPLFLSSAGPEVVERRVQALRRRAVIGTERWLDEQEEMEDEGYGR